VFVKLGESESRKFRSARSRSAHVEIEKVLGVQSPELRDSPPFCVYYLHP
jgi:hypothetical protein